MKNQLHILLTIFCLVLTACNRNHDGLLGSTAATRLTDIVTFTGVDNDNHAKFRLDMRDDEAPVMLFTTVKPPQQVKVNDRVLLYYAVSHKAPDNSYWNVNAMALTRIFSDSIRVNSNPIDSYKMHQLKIKSAWRTGEFINIYGQVEHTGKSRLLYMMLDRDTRGKENVDAYLVHDLLDTPQDSIFYWRDFYLSVNVGALKKDPDPCRYITLHYNDATSSAPATRTFTIK